MNRFIVLMAIFCAPLMLMAADFEQVSIIPKPTTIQLGKRSYAISKDLVIYAKNKAVAIADILSVHLQTSGIHVSLHADQRAYADITLVIDDDLPEISPDAYHLSVTATGVLIKANNQAGLFYGAQTLLQLMPPQVYEEKSISLPVNLSYLDIKDAPRFEWRGLMVDLSRHFFSKEVLKKTIDRMAMHKLNRLHLHLTDDPGWRLEIERYPKLTGVGAVGNISNPDAVAEYLSKDDVRDLVEYASQRFIEIVPEIDMPGHGGAAAKAYPQFFDGGITYNIGKQGTYRFVENVLSEVMDLFPSQYIHFGGDELRNHYLENLPEVKKLMKDKGFNNIHELEGHFDRFVAAFITRKGRTPIGWDEVARYDIGSNAIVQWWRGQKPETRDDAVDNGYRVIVSPADHVYLDYPQSPGEPGAPWEGNDNGLNSVALIYHWKVVPEHYKPAQTKQIIGIEAALWTEFIRTEGYLEYMLFPRLAVVAEVAWSSAQNRNFAAFKRRLKVQYRRYEAMGINYRIPVPGDRLGKNSAQYLVH